MTNSEIRRKAWRLCRKNLGLLIGFWLAYAVVFSAVSVMLARMPEGVLGSALQLALIWLLSPVFSLGIARVSMGIWRGQRMGASDFLAFVRDGQLLGHSLTFLLVYQLVNSFLTLGMSLFSALAGASLLVLPLLMALMIWFSARLFLSSYLFVLNPMQPALQPISDSFLQMKGRVGRYIGFEIGTFWWLFLLLFALVFALVYALAAVNPQTLTNPSALSMLQYLMIALLGPYVSMTSAGYADNILSGESSSSY